MKINKKNRKFRLSILITFLVSVFIFSFISYQYDSVRINKGKSPLFTVPILFCKDGGSVYRIGLGYGVFEWKRLETKYVNGNTVNGYLEGTEMILFPECYKVLVSRGYKPKIKLVFKDNL